MGFFVSAHGGRAKWLSSQKSVTHILHWWNLTVISYLNKVHKIRKSRDKPHEFCWHQHFFTKNHQFLSLQRFFSEHGWISDDVSKIGYSRSSSNKGNWNKGYDFKTSVFGVTNKILLLESNSIVDVVRWPKFGNFRISMREVIITSIL